MSRKGFPIGVAHFASLLDFFMQMFVVEPDQLHLERDAEQSELSPSRVPADHALGTDRGRTGLVRPGFHDLLRGQLAAP